MEAGQTLCFYCCYHSFDQCMISYYLAGSSSCQVHGQTTRRKNLVVEYKMSRGQINLLQQKDANLRRRPFARWCHLLRQSRISCALSVVLFIGDSFLVLQIKDCVEGKARPEGETILFLLSFCFYQLCAKWTFLRMVKKFSLESHDGSALLKKALFIFLPLVPVFHVCNMNHCLQIWLSLIHEKRCATLIMTTKSYWSTSFLFVWFYFSIKIP